MRVSIIFLVAFVFFASCSKTHKCIKTLTCDHHQLIPLFNGFDSTDLDSVMVYTFTAGSTFMDTINKHLFTQPDSVQNYGNTSPAFYENGFGNLQLVSGYDYELIIQHTGQTIKITNMVDTVNTTEVVDCRFPGWCSTQITGIAVTGSTYSFINAVPPILSYIVFVKQ